MDSIRISDIRNLGGDGEVVVVDSGVVNIMGPSTIDPGTSETYHITDYDSFSSYDISVDQGSVSTNVDEFTITVPGGVTGFVEISITKNNVKRVIEVPVGELTQRVNRPSITFPSDGATSIPLSTRIQATQFSTTPSGVGSHLNSQWQISNSSNFGTILKQATITDGNLTRWDVTDLPLDNKLYVRVRYEGSIGTSDWSTAVEFDTIGIQINKPTLTVNDPQYEVTETPTFTSSAFSVTPSGADSHVASTWILRDDTESSIWTRSNSTSNRTSLMLPPGVLQESSSYSMEVKHIGSVGESVFSDRLPFITENLFSLKCQEIRGGGTGTSNSVSMIDGDTFLIGSQRLVTQKGVWILKTTDGGSTFSQVFENTALEFGSIYIDNNGNGLHLAILSNRTSGTPRNSVYKSVDGGDSWTHLTDVSGSSSNNRFLRHVSGATWVSGISADLYVTNDDGNSWQRRGPSNNNYDIYTVGNTSLVARREIRKFTGTSFNQSTVVYSPPTGGEDIQVITSDGNGAWGAGGSRGGIYMSHDDGETWTQVVESQGSSSSYAVRGAAADGKGRWSFGSLEREVVSEDGGNTFTVRSITVQQPSFVSEMKYLDGTWVKTVNGAGARAIVCK